MRKIVVGIDGSAESQQALRWAVAEAKLPGAHLGVVHAWKLPHIPSGYGAGPDIHTQMLTANKRMAEDVVENALDQLADEPKGVELTRTVVGGFTGLLLGSVGQQCAHHAPCPVVIVPRR